MKASHLSEVLSAWATASGPLHARLASSIKEAIRRGDLPPGTKLPSERALAKTLAISRTTVLTAYNDLRSSGWLESRAGSGTWVNRATSINARAKVRADMLARSPLLNFLLAEGSGVIDLSVATTRPLTSLSEDAFELPAEERRWLFEQRDYMPFGFPALRERIAARYCKLGVKTRAEQILITTGAQQAISLVTALYVQRGDPVLTEDPTFFGALEAFRLAGARLAPLEVGVDHIFMQALRNRITTVRPRLFYVTPTFQNPTGATMGDSSRHRLAELIAEFEIPTIEDETLAEMVLEGNRPTPVAAFGGGENIFTIGSLSKLFCAGLRVGWVRTSAAQAARLARIKSSIDLGSAVLPQAIGARLLTRLDEAVERRRVELQQKRDLVEQLLLERLPDWTFTHPCGGLSIWARLQGADATAFAQLALRRGVAIAPGNVFSIADSYADYVRIPFLLDAESLKTGMEQLSEAWHEMPRSGLELRIGTTIL
ncbi:MAG: PLP-dependent aminotransferase family protein [Acidobacteriaceae bacterium]|nr:PLP-dependent aminotransferase family protein [Acidobacteriaceae bacterium]